jgi:hypothetical protein
MYSGHSIVGSLGAACMIPVALALSAWLPDRRLNRITKLLGLSAMAVLRPRVTRLGEFLGGGTLAGGAVVGLGFLLPWMSWPQLVVFGVGGLLGAIGMLGTPVWFVLLGRHLAMS